MGIVKVRDEAKVAHDTALANYVGMQEEDKAAWKTRFAAIQAAKDAVEASTTAQAGYQTSKKAAMTAHSNYANFVTAGAKLGYIHRVIPNHLSQGSLACSSLFTVNIFHC